MSVAEVSDLSMVTAAVAYLVAFFLHSAEWGSARGLATVRPDDGSEDRPRIRVDLMGRLAVGMTVLAFVVHTLAVVARGVAADRAPWGNMYEFVSASLLFAVSVYLVAAWKLGARWLGIGVTLLAAVGLGASVTVFYVDVAPLVPALHSVWFIIHIVAAAIAGAAFNIGAIASVLYLVRKRVEASGAPVRGYLAKLPNAAALDVFAYRLHAFAFPLWTFTIAAGAIWAQYAWGRFWNWDPKETWSFVTWVIYAAYLHARATAGWKGTPAAIIAIIGVLSFWFNFVGVNLLFSGLHSYAGI